VISKPSERGACEGAFKSASADQLGRRAGGLVLGLILAVASHSTADEPGRRFILVQIRAKMARFRADLERSSGNISPTPRAGKRPAIKAPVPPGRRRPHSELSHRFRRGDSFAYSVEITTGSEGTGRVERFQGRPYVSVMSDETTGKAELLDRGRSGRRSQSDELSMWLLCIAPLPDGWKSSRGSSFGSPSTDYPLPPAHEAGCLRQSVTQVE
jgi:hypothetical protein